MLGVAQVVAYGGDVKQYQVLVHPAKLQAFNVTLQQVTEAVEAANVNAPGGFLITRDRERLIRGVGRIESIEDLQQSVITARDGQPVRLVDVADVEIGAAIKRGDGSLDGQPAIVVMINKQPQADTARKRQDATDSVSTTISQPPQMNVAIHRLLSNWRRNASIQGIINLIGNS